MSDRSTPMACPVDGSTLTMSERQGIEIDYCPQCRGVWLDRGELDKIIERNVPDVVAPEVRYEPSRGPSADYDDGRGRHDSSHGYGHGRRKKSFLSELFD